MKCASCYSSIGCTLDMYRTVVTLHGECEIGVGVGVGMEDCENICTVTNLIIQIC